MADEKERMTYASAGVDIDLKSEGISALVEKLSQRRRGKFLPIELPGQFTGLIDFGEYALSLCTDGVGTKLMVASEMGIWDTVGIDCIAMNVNDTICVGAEPIAFVDYIAVDTPKPDILAEIGKGLQKGAELANIAIVGGEVAVMPEIVNGIDLTGTALGFVRKSDIIYGDKCVNGDVIIGLPSNGIHSNGLTLARKIFERAGIDYRESVEEFGKSAGVELLTPTKIYVDKVLRLIKGVEVHGLVNITGSGLRNFLRVKKGLGFSIDEPMSPQPIFEVLQKLGDVSTEEMYQTFNMGLGFAAIVPEKSAKQAIELLGAGSKIIGRVNETGIVSVPQLNLEYMKY